MRRRRFMQAGILLPGTLGLMTKAIANGEDDEDFSGDYKEDEKAQARHDDKKLDLVLPSEEDVLAGPVWTMPEEGSAHVATWMSFGATLDVWGEANLAEVQSNLADVAKTIAKYEPVFMLVNEDDVDLLKDLVNGHDVTVIEHPVDDLWIRDTGPTFVFNEKEKVGGVDFNFNGWGLKQTFFHDAAVAKFVDKFTKAKYIQSSIVMEGGALEVDGEGTAIITESCILNENRNPGRSKASIEKELKHLLGLEKIIWLPGIKGKDITDAHTDFYARFVRPGFVLANWDEDEYSYDYEVTRKHMAILEKSTDAKGRKLKIETLTPPLDIPKKWQSDTFAAGYINYYVGNGFVIMPKFGDRRADRKAYNVIKAAYPDLKIEQVEIMGIASGGGGIHCSTQQQIKL